VSRHKRIRELYFTRQSSALLFLGFSAGLPNITLVSSLAFWLTDDGFSTTQIGFLSLVVIPYSLKFLWAPLVDNRRPALSLPWGRRRAWILWAQILLAIAIGITAVVGPWGAIDPVTGLDPSGRDSWKIVWTVVAAGFLIALFSATQDISNDAYRVDVSTDETRAAAASVSVTGYRLAAAGAGAAAIMVAARVGWPTTIAITALLMFLCIGATILAPDPPDDIAPRRSFGKAVMDPLRELVRRLGRRAAEVALFVVVFKLPDTMTLPMLPAFLQRHLGYHDDDVAIMRQLVGMSMTIFGALVGAVIVPRLGMFRSLLLFGILQAVSTGVFLTLGLLHIPADMNFETEFGLAPWAHWVAPGTLALFAAVTVEYFCAGLVTAGFVAYLMWLCDRRWAGTHFAILTSLMALGAAGAGVTAGALVDLLIRHDGAERAWPIFFAICIVAGLPGVLLMYRVTRPSLAGSSD